MSEVDLKNQTNGVFSLLVSFTLESLYKPKRSEITDITCLYNSCFSANIEEEKRKKKKKKNNNNNNNNKKTTTKKLIDEEEKRKRRIRRRRRTRPRKTRG